MYIDIGANLTHDSFDDDFDEVLERAADAQVIQMIVTGASTEGSDQAASLAASHDHLFATAGIHPHHAEETTSEVLQRLRELATSDKVVAIGETGLDFFRDFSPRPTQIDSFEKHIQLAIETGLPMFLHERDSHPTFADILSAYNDNIERQVVHCFTGEKEALYAYLDLDCYIGITGWICDERRGEHLIALVNDIPANRLLIETDAPYLLPRNIRPKPKSRRNEPAYLSVVAEKVADCRQVSIEEISETTTENARRFFNLPAHL
ncbi:MAG: YchF/TatD family DNA exonuclease, partial [Gammaproteobacteria bacterium]|nr:YchF/TatD family DNA exonuclease [Gammaproteobacteria bacterium]